MTTNRTKQELAEENQKLREYLETTQQELEHIKWDYSLLNSNFEALAIHGIQNLVNSVTQPVDNSQNPEQ